MTECQNVDMREALPDLLHGQLPAEARAHVELHVTACTACADELAILRAVLAGAPAPAVDVARIARAVPAYQAPRRRVNVAYLRLAAALLVAAAGISSVHLIRQRESAPASSGRVAGRTGAVSIGASAAAAVAGSAAAPTGDRGIALVSTAGISDDRLAELIASMDNLQAIPPASPPSVTPPALVGGGA